MGEPISTRVGHAIAKVLGIDLGPPSPELERDESNTYSYFEHHPTCGDWLTDITPTPPQIRGYIWNMFPFLHWIGSYNTQWLIGDLVAGTLDLRPCCTKRFFD